MEYIYCINTERDFALYVDLHKKKSLFMTQKFFK